MSAEQTMMFEVEDLNVASPATVSRVGIIYMEPKGLGIDVLIQSWLATLPSTLPTEIIVILQTLFDTYLFSGMYACQALLLVLSDSSTYVKTYIHTYVLSHTYAQV